MNSKHVQTEIKNAILVIIMPEKMNYLIINLTIYVKHLYAENYKMVMKEIKDPTKWRDIMCSWIERLNKIMIFLLFVRGELQKVMCACLFRISR